MLYENPWTRAADKIIQAESLKKYAKEAMDAAKAAQKQVKDFEKEMEAEEWVEVKAKNAVKAKNLKKAMEFPTIEDTKVTNCCGGFSMV